MKENKRKVVTIILIIVGILVVVIMSIIILNNVIKLKNGGAGKVLDGVNITAGTINYTTLSDGTRENNSKSVKDEQIVENLVISNVKIVYKDGMSKLSVEILNKLSDINDLKLKVVFLADDTQVITEKFFVVGSVKEKETKNIDVEVQGDVSNTYSIRYEIVD